MKRKGNIFSAVIEIENIKKAILNASKGKKHRKSVERIICNIEHYTLEIHNMLKNKTYTPSPYIEMKIHDRNKKKGKNYI